MDISSIGSVPAAAAQASTGDAVALSVLRKSMDVQAQTAAQLISALPQPTNNPANLGNKVDAFA